MPTLVASGWEAGERLSGFEGVDESPFACADFVWFALAAVVCAVPNAVMQSRVVSRANALFHAMALVKETREEPGTGTITPD